MDTERIKELIRDLVDSITNLALEFTLPQTENSKTDNDNDNVDNESPRELGSESIK